jgi:hypothetical protein
MDQREMEFPGSAMIEPEQEMWVARRRVGIDPEISA